MPHESAPAPRCQLLNHKLTLNDPLEAVTNFCEPEQWLLNKDSKALEINNWGIPWKVLTL